MGYKRVLPFKIIPGTKFAVDAFSYGHIPGIEFYFLTHFHSDHYTGLTSKFNKPIYCSRITAELCVSQLRVNRKLLNIITLDETSIVNGVKVTPVDANHCPGSIMIIFDFQDGRSILHCGDFRANQEMEDNIFIKSRHFDTIYLDTTYCDPKYDFPTQEESVEKAISVTVQKEQQMTFEGSDPNRLLIVCGAYLIGKEKFFMEMAKQLNIDIWCPDKKGKLLKTAVSLKCSTLSHKCRLHILPMAKINLKDLDLHLKANRHFTDCLAFKPSGWEYPHGSFQQYGNVTVFGIPYSEHSSFSEMQKFMKFCKPRCIISTIPGHANRKIIKQYLNSWTRDEQKKKQTRISDFFKSQRKT